MATEDDDDELLLFQDVRIISSTAPALLCRISGRSVWIPRRHITGMLWCTGDRGKLFIRRWVARDRDLIDPRTGSPPAAEPIVRTLLPAALHLARGECGQAPLETGDSGGRAEYSPTLDEGAVPREPMA